jgi:hypothetical protein
MYFKNIHILCALFQIMHRNGWHEYKLLQLHKFYLTPLPPMQISQTHYFFLIFIYHFENPKPIVLTLLIVNKRIMKNQEHIVQI